MAIIFKGHEILSQLFLTGMDRFRAYFVLKTASSGVDGTGLLIDETPLTSWEGSLLRAHEDCTPEDLVAAMLALHRLRGGG